MENTNMQAILDSISAVDTIGDLKALNRLVVQRIRAVDSQRQSSAAVQLCIGQRVEFKTRRRGTIEGVITKINKMTVKIRTDADVVWTVSPTLVEVL